MPEGPEVYTLAKDLKRFVGKTFSIIIDQGFTKRVTGDIPTHIIVRDVGSKGKMLYFEVDKGYMIFHLGLTGKFSLAAQPFTRVSFIGDESQPFYYVDQVKIGTLEFVTDLQPELSSLGPDIIEVKPDELLGIFTKGRKSNPRLMIVDFLVKQSVISGIGNYLRSEILYDASISYNTKMRDLTDNQLDILVASTKKVVGDVVAVNGSYKYIRLDGLHGGYQFSVYKKQNAPDGSIVQKIKHKGTYVFYT